MDSCCMAGSVTSSIRVSRRGDRPAAMLRVGLLRARCSKLVNCERKAHTAGEALPTLCQETSTNEAMWWLNCQVICINCCRH
jgi:hypothetical protein